MSPPQARTELARLELAESVEVVDGRLKVDGGGADTFVVPGLPYAGRLALACTVRIPAAELETEHDVIITVRGPDGREVASPARHSISVARPTGLALRQGVEVGIAINVDVTFASLGRHTVTARLSGSERRVQFEVRPSAPPGISEEEENFFDEEMGLIP